MSAQSLTVADAFPAPSLRRLAYASVLTVAVGFGGLLTWAALTPLDSAVPATGMFVAATKRKTVTLADNATLKTLLVREGDRVAQDQPLIQLDDVQTRSAMNQAEAQYWGGIAKTARLDAELAGQRVLGFPDPLVQAAARDPAIAAFMQAERGLFNARWDTFDSNARITGRKVQQLEAQGTAVRAQLASLATRMALTQDQARGTESLLRDGFAPRNQALEMRRNLAQLEGDIADATGRLSQVRDAIEQTKLEFTNTAQTRQSDSARELQEAKVTLADVAQRLTATRDTLAHGVVTAPEAGIVTDLHYFTPGSAIQAGQPVLDIVPGDGKLLIEAAVEPINIEHVHVGQRVNVKLSAYKAHRVPTVEGRLVYVAADRTQDPKGEPIFLVRAELDPAALTPFPGVAVYAGMPADVLIIGGERSALDFLVSPILEGMRGGMREE